MVNQRIQNIFLKNRIKNHVGGYKWNKMESRNRITHIHHLLFFKNTNAIQYGKEDFFFFFSPFRWWWSNGYPIGGRERALIPIITQYTRTNSRRMIDLNVKAKTTQLLRISPWYLGIGNFLGPKCTDDERKLDLH